jgi:peptidylamidoglycolate lyase
MANASPTLRKTLRHIAGIVASRISLARAVAAHPRGMNFVVTYRCNFRCATCNIGSVSKVEPDGTRDELSLEEIDRFFSDNRGRFSRMGAMQITGGEPFLREDLTDVVATVTRHLPDLSVWIATNGSLPGRIGEAVAAMTRHCRDLGVTLSLHGGRATHDAYTGVPGSYDVALDTLERLITLRRTTPGLKLTLGFTLTPSNRSEMGEVYDLSRKHGLGFSFRLAHGSNVYFNNPDYPLDYSKLDDTLASILKTMERDSTCSDLADPLRLARLYYFHGVRRYARDRRGPRLPCSAGTSSFFLDPRGDVYPCIMMDAKLGNIRDTAFADLWTSARADCIRREIREGRCPSCWIECETYRDIYLHPEVLLPFAAKQLATRIRGGAGAHRTGGLQWDKPQLLADTARTVLRRRLRKHWARLARSSAVRRPDIEPRSSYTVVSGWPDLGNHVIAGVTGVAMDPRGGVVLLHRASAKWGNEAMMSGPAVLRLDAESGQVRAAWGENRFASPHGLCIDPQGHVWVSDIALNKVFKFSPDGELLLTLGSEYRGLAKICYGVRKRANIFSYSTDPGQFAMPTGITVAGSGRIYVADGHMNRRIAAFSPEGEFLFEWGEHGKGPGQFDLPHGLALDAEGRVHVADRENSRIQVFDGNGRFLKEWKSEGLGRPYNMDFGPDGCLYVVDGGDQDPLAPRGRVIKMTADGAILERWGSFGRGPGQFDEGHDVAVGADLSVYVVDIQGGRIQKFQPR